MPHTLSPTEHDIFQRLCQHSDRWTMRFMGDSQDPPYLRMSHLAQDIVRLADRGHEKSRLQRFFASLEELFQQYGDRICPEKDLLAAGLLEYLQGYSRGGGMHHPEKLENLLGPATHRCWVGLLKGWFGENITSMDRLNRIMFPEVVQRYKIHLIQLGHTLTIERKPKAIASLRLLYECKLGPFLSVEQQDHLGLHAPFARIEAWTGKMETPDIIVVGNTVDEGGHIRHAAHNKEWYWLDLRLFFSEWAIF